MIVKKSNGILILVLLVIAIIVGIIFIPITGGKTKAAFVKVDGEHNGNDWMKNISSDKSIGELSIPGTHDTCTYKASGISSRISKCQDRNLKEQFNMGVRYIDIRCSNKDKKFSICHGKDHVGMNFDQVLKDCYSFLDKNKSECIVMSLKEEDSNTKDEFEKRFKEYIKDDADKWYLGTTIPVLENVRGKIVLIRRFTGRYCGIDATGWKDNRTFNYKQLFIQDKYKVSDAPTKMSEIDDFFKKIVPSKTCIYINYTSATMYGKNVGSDMLSYIINDNVRDLAIDINERLMTYSFEKNHCYGVVAMDFADEQICKLIYETNEY